MPAVRDGGSDNHVGGPRDWGKPDGVAAAPGSPSVPCSGRNGSAKDLCTMLSG